MRVIKVLQNIVITVLNYEYKNSNLAEVAIDTKKIFIFRLKKERTNYIKDDTSMNQNHLTKG